MIPGPGTRVLVWGFGRHGGGQAAARFCAALGASVEILELKPAATFGADGAAAIAAGWPWHIGDGTHPALKAADLVVASPAIPPRAWPASHPPRTAPEGLFCAAHRGPRIVVTGTKGKSTTAHLLASLLGWKVAGNSFEPLLDLLVRHGPEVPVVCELSSFQLWYLGLAPPPPQFAVTVFTSLAVDHLDWHPDLAHYQAAKLAALNWSPVVAVASGMVDRLPTGAHQIPPVHCRDGAFCDHIGVLAQRADLPLLGEHNAANACLAVATALHLGISRQAIAQGLRSIRGLPHRLEELQAVDGWLYVNDSIATTPESAMAALAAVSGPLAIILGGSDKGADFNSLAQAVVKRGALPIVIGSTAEQLAACLRQAGAFPHVAGTLTKAVAVARINLVPGGTILLSPACASFDQFQGFEDRGAQFRKLAQGGSP